MNASEQQRALLETRNRGAEVAMLAQRHENLQKAVQRSMDKFRGEEVNPLAEEVITRVIFKVLSQYQSKVNAGMQDSLSDLLGVFKQKVSAHIFETADSWRVKNRDDILFPAGCRYLYTRGASTIAIIEQLPQTRSLLFNDGMMDYERTRHSRVETKRISLSLPYVYFFLHFNDRENADFMLTGVYSAWRATALTGLRDSLSIPVLPNTHSNCMICMGNTSGRATGHSISQLASDAISNYWNSCFTGDLSDYWWAKGSLDHRIATGSLWSKNTETDPTFILSVRFHDDYTAKHIVQRLAGVEEMPDETAIRHKLTSVIDNCVETLYAKIFRYFKNTKFDRFYPKPDMDKVSQALAAVVQEMSDVILALEHEINKLGESMQELRPGMHWKKRGDFWQDSY